MYDYDFCHPADTNGYFDDDDDDVDDKELMKRTWMLVAEKPRDGKKAADVKSHMLSQMGRGKKNQMAEPNLAD